MRKYVDFNTDWLFAKSADLPAALPQDWQSVSLPHTWNAEDGQDGGNDYWRGTACYCKAFSKPKLAEGEQLWLEIPAAAMTAEVWLNGKRIARHEGGYSTFRAELTPTLKAENLLCITVDNGETDRVYPQKADFTFYGGLYRGVRLLTVPVNHFALDYHGGSGLKITPVVDLITHTATVTVEAWVSGGSEVTFTVAGQAQTAPVLDNQAAALFTIRSAHLWDGLDDPYLYTATARLDSGDEVSARFGCRVFAVDAQKGFFLNGRPYPLRGVSRHQDRAGAGNALTLADHKQDMEIIKEIGANTLRLAHYQHAQEFYDLCDENGIVAWAEIPYITCHMPAGRENTLSQMTELIVQNYNHPCIACWGLSNEITASTPVDEDLLENHRLLNELCHRLDPSRFTTMADVFMLETDSPLLDIPDVNSYNLYFGWYLGELEQNDKFFDDFHAKYPDRVIGFSEYGADANPQYQSSTPERSDYTEAYQCLYHEHILRMIEDRPWLWATHVWNLFDFAADGRDEGGKHGVNQKGLVTIDRQLKKDAFYLYKAYWSKTPFVHLCGRRYIDRAEDTTQIKVYSNQSAVTLLVDGIEAACKGGDKIFTFDVPLKAEHTITAVAGDCRDEITIRRAAAPNPVYQFAQAGGIVNWFDKDDFKPGYYSIKDTFGALMSHPATAAIVGAVMAKAQAARGDVAKSTAGNKNLEAMMAGMTLQALLKQAGDAVPKEAVQQLNAALQKIPKAAG